MVVGLIYYTVRDDKSSSASLPDAPASQFEFGASEEQNFLNAVTIPKDFAKLSFPVRIEKLDGMIQHCRHLLTQDTQYHDKLREKLISLYALRCVLVAQSGVDPAAEIQELEKEIAQFVESEAEQETHHYLLAYVHMTLMAANPESEFYDKTMATINQIQESTPAPPPKVAGCYNSALRYFVGSKDKEAAADLLRLLGKKMVLAKEQGIKDYGLALQDYPNFSSFYQDNLVNRQVNDDSLTRTLQLLEQIKRTPPKSTETYDLLLKLPEQFLQAGNLEVAKKILKQIDATAADANEVIKDYVTKKIEKSKTRIELMGNLFPLSGFDVRGIPIKGTKKEQTVIVFWNPDQKTSLEALVRVQDSRLYDQWSTELLLASVSELTADEIIEYKKQFSSFRFIDGPTSKNWVENSGVNDVPYAITLDQDGIVRRFATP